MKWTQGFLTIPWVPRGEDPQVIGPVAGVEGIRCTKEMEASSGRMASCDVCKLKSGFKINPNPYFCSDCCEWLYSNGLPCEPKKCDFCPTEATHLVIVKVCEKHYTATTRDAEGSHWFQSTKITHLPFSLKQLPPQPFLHHGVVFILPLHPSVHPFTTPKHQHLKGVEGHVFLFRFNSFPKRTNGKNVSLWYLLPLQK